MQLKRCDQGHYFDPSKHSGCPHCGIKIDFDFVNPVPPAQVQGGVVDDRTVAMNMPGMNPPPARPAQPAADDRTVAFHSAAAPSAPPAASTPSAPNVPSAPVAPSAPAVNSFSSENRTIGIYRKKMGIEPVVGWLVCIEGADRGRDFRIISERNFIGRSEKSDIAISGDETISREGHAIISFNPKKNSYRLYPGESRGIVYLNDDEIVGATELKAYDVIELGQTKLMFIPFCGESFQWMQE